MLDSSVHAQLKTYLERISQPVEIVVSADEGEKSREMLELLADIESASGLMQIVPQRDDAQVKPSFALRSPGGDARVRFAGLPMGACSLNAEMASGVSSEPLRTKHQIRSAAGTNPTAIALRVVQL